MNTQILIYSYGAVCLSMIIFNFLCILVFKNRESREKQQSISFTDRIKKELAEMEKGEPLSEKEYCFLIKKLSSIGNLAAFDRSLLELEAENPQEKEAYIQKLHAVFLYLTSVYVKKEDVQSAYFLSFLNRHGVSRLREFDVLIAEVMPYFRKDSVFCSLKAMDTLFISGQVENVLKGLRILNQKDDYINSRLIVTGLSSFTGDAKRLMLALQKKFDSYSVSLRAAFIDYFSSITVNCDDFVFTILSDDRQNEELRYSAIRYFGRRHSEKAYPLLCKFAMRTGKDQGVYISQAVRSLAIYPGDKTVGILKAALCSPNFHVRYNATLSLERLGISYNELADILSGDDRYAKEMVTYQAEHRSLKERQVASV